MDAIPIIVPGCHHHNAKEYARVSQYYANKGDEEMAQSYHDMWAEEKRKAYENDELSWFDKLLRKFMK